MNKQTEAMLAWMKDQETINRKLLSLIMALQPTTAAPQTTVPTREALSDAAAPASTDQPTQRSSQSATKTDDAGPAEPVSGCVHWTLDLTIEQTPRNEPGLDSHAYRWMLVRCKCGASWWYAKTPAPVAEWPWLISQSPASPSSAALPNEGSAPSESSASSDRPVLLGCKCAAPFIRPSWGRLRSGGIEISGLTCDNEGCDASLRFDTAADEEGADYLNDLEAKVALLAEALAESCPLHNGPGRTTEDEYGRLQHFDRTCMTWHVCGLTSHQRDLLARISPSLTP